MAVKEILLMGDPVLRETSKKVTAFDTKLKNLVDDLKDTLMDFQQRKKIGRAIAAPQIGVLQKAIYVHTADRSFALVNPEIIWTDDQVFDVWDSCFSFDVAFFVNIQRFRTIKVRYHNEWGIPHEEIFEDDLSELLQHEIDHLSGIMATDHLKNNQNIIMRKEWEKRYC
ncbi:MAG: peptide deformylase [Bacteroidales bacterium]|nr:peptide deformylase [Bacteroidales bacterium]